MGSGIITAATLSDLGTGTASLGGSSLSGYVIQYSEPRAFG